MRFIRSLLDKHTMYQVVIAVLVFWVGVAFAASLIGELPYSVGAMSASLLVLFVSALAVHYASKALTNAPANLGSTIITVLILFFIFDPSLEQSELMGLAGVATAAILSKYILAYRHLHLVNPVALAAVVGGLFSFAFATWWVATPAMAIAIALGGVLIVMKIDRPAMVAMGLVVASIGFAIQTGLSGSLSFGSYLHYLVSAPLLFFMFVMLTEPLTTPAGRKLQIAYGAVIGVLMSVPFAIGPLYSSPELALVMANVLFYPFSLRSRLKLKLVDKEMLADQTVEFRFESSPPFNFIPGQYLEWTLPHENPDNRGIRRYFTIASAPTESEVRLTVRLNENGSSYKTALEAMKPGDIIHATALRGDFLLPKEPEKHKLLFVAGGIGVTPFRSHVQSLIDNGTEVDATLIYCNVVKEDIAYKDFFKQAEKAVGLKTVYTLDKPSKGWKGETGFIDEAMLKRHVPDVAERIIYISGPPGMVGAYSKLFRTMGVPIHNIHTDYFPGLA